MINTIVSKRNFVFVVNTHQFKVHTVRTVFLIMNVIQNYMQIKYQVKIKVMIHVQYCKGLRMYT